VRNIGDGDGLTRQSRSCWHRGHRYQVKCIVVKPGAKPSFLSHFHRLEHWIVVRGTLEVTRGDESSRAKTSPHTLPSARNIASPILAGIPRSSSRCSPVHISTRKASCGLKTSMTAWLLGDLLSESHFKKCVKQLSHRTVLLPGQDPSL
jgi:hypothetical protein